MANARPFRKKDVFHDFASEGKEYRFTPRTFIDALADAAEQMDYSNFHTDKFERIEEIIRRYCEEHGIPLGLSRKQWEAIEKRRHAHYMRVMKGRANPMKKLQFADKFFAKRAG